MHCLGLYCSYSLKHRNPYLLIQLTTAMNSSKLFDQEKFSKSRRPFTPSESPAVTTRDSDASKHKIHLNTLRVALIYFNSTNDIHDLDETLRPEKSSESRRPVTLRENRVYSSRGSDSSHKLENHLCIEAATQEICNNWIVTQSMFLSR
jgi:hypothetical protein